MEVKRAAGGVSSVRESAREEGSDRNQTNNNAPATGAAI
jgi:hypothetical protein